MCRFVARSVHNVCVYVLVCVCVGVHLYTCWVERAN